jgi:hypothetical protein
MDGQTQLGIFLCILMVMAAVTVGLIYLIAHSSPL